ncbi:D-alanine--D-alanine ligase family protein [Dolichospermum circinale]|jgi:D-alanine-D-alanine ligase|uniref:D-alanine--D-alanine ligase family protein n=2 Tax=Dolichospermum circinale TaxID=109265 RepID=UPI0003F5EBFB|nr:D-alanine--D-alanine ligase [Dolichospermum circinale]MDB9466269.1 D-alanine--D-alanine ligase [Dolichospermum circinale CS-539/09]MDB9469884.1 D-alanine--D-alanine ligase [Dolichospermum circinale CS-539]MDB9474059.1 D-alanine--D-alanine ligase [Dolichospermum circinale CS-537/11]MDB9479044.1 D-alanine--D-alanine ligase [Dolichospermum circinale CS-537/03]
MGLFIGLCYDLKIEYIKAGFSTTEVMEFDDEETIIGLEKALGDLGHQVEPIGNGRELARRLANGKRWDLVFNIAEGVKGRSREAQVPAVCELFDQPYTFSDPLTCALTLDKALAKRIVRDRSLPTAPFIVVNNLTEAANINLPIPLFFKPVAEGSSKGITGQSLVKEQSELITTYQALHSQFQQPILVETFLPGREVTVGIIGNGSNTKVVGVMEVIFTDQAETEAYTTLNKKEYLERVAYKLLVNTESLAIQAEQLALDVYHTFDCRDAARVDLRCDADGVLHFLEINPLPGLDHIYSDLPIMGRLAGVTYTEIISAIVNAAWQRYSILQVNEVQPYNHKTWQRGCFTAGS